MNTLNIAENRNSVKWTRREQIFRVLFAIVQPIFFRLSPRPFWGWRRWILRRFGATVGKDVHVYPTVQITIPWNVTLGDSCAIGDRAIIYALGPIYIGEKATVSQRAHLCAGSHDWRCPAMTLIKPPIEIGAETWVCADAFVGPGVIIGARTIIGARAVVMSDVEDDVIIVGNPGKVLKRR